jgi:hypothetical protein
MGWNLESADGNVTLSANADGNGGMSGTLIVDGTNFAINGNWAASGSLPGRNASVFFVAGEHDIGSSLPDYLGASGNMVGPGDWPQSIQIAGSTCSTNDGVVNPFDVTLLPVMNTDPGALAGAYGESGCFLVIDVSNEGQVPVCIFGTVGGNPLSSTDLGKVCTGTDPVTINIPKAAPNQKPVCILFKAPQNHFVNPPLAEAHSQISKILFDTAGANPANAVGLVLEYANGPGKRQTAVINFNEGPGPHERIHLTIIIRPQ